MKDWPTVFSFYLLHLILIGLTNDILKASLESAKNKKPHKITVLCSFNSINLDFFIYLCDIKPLAKTKYGLSLSDIFAV